MKQVLSFILLLIFSAQTFSQGLVLAGFCVNRSFIAKNLCINRSRPQMHCNGRCQLMKKFRQQEKQDRGNADGKLSANTQLLLLNAGFPSAAETIINTVKAFSQICPGPVTDRSYPLFHPPA